MSGFVIPLAADVSLANQWTAFWGKISGQSQVWNFVGMIGVAMVVYAFVKWLWDRRRGGGGSHAGLVTMIVFGAVLASPNILMPIALRVADWLINLILRLF